MKSLIQKIFSFFNLNNKDEEIVLKYAEKKEKGQAISEEEKKEALKSAIRLTKDKKINED